MTNIPVGTPVRLVRTLAPASDRPVPRGTVGVISDDTRYGVAIVLVQFPDEFGCWGVGDEDVEVVE